MANEIERALASVRERIAAAAARVGRPQEEIGLVGVTKGVPPARIAEAVRLGLLEIGENRVRELGEKQHALPDPSVRWHYIGTLQRNKVRPVVGRVDLIHSVDSATLARVIGERARAADTVQDLLLQVNTSGEPSKHGVSPDAVPAEAEAIAATNGVRLLGLMTIARMGDPQGARASFGSLRELRDGLGIPGVIELSMGMSDDFEEAVEEGSTIVRIGSAIFGPRP
jgi:pyridoxal phosphate enzyme (YggS family)